MDRRQWHLRCLEDVKTIAEKVRGCWVASIANVVDEVSKEYIKNQTSPEPNDSHRLNGGSIRFSAVS